MTPTDADRQRAREIVELSWAPNLPDGCVENAIAAAIAAARAEGLHAELAGTEVGRIIEQLHARAAYLSQNVGFLMEVNAINDAAAALAGLAGENARLKLIVGLARDLRAVRYTGQATYSVTVNPLNRLKDAIAEEDARAALQEPPDGT